VAAGIGKLEEIAATFRSVDPELRVQLLLDYAKRLPGLPDRLRARRDAGLDRVHECTTPLFLFVEPGAEEGTLRLHIDVAEEAPTVRGIASILVHALDGAPPADFAALPDDLIRRLGLDDLIRMTRRVGIAALVALLRRRGPPASRFS